MNYGSSVVLACGPLPGDVNPMNNALNDAEDIYSFNKDPVTAKIRRITIKDLMEHLPKLMEEKRIRFERQLEELAKKEKPRG